MLVKGPVTTGISYTARWIPVGIRESNWNPEIRLGIQLGIQESGNPHGILWNPSGIYRNPGIRTVRNQDF